MGKKTSALAVALGLTALALALGWFAFRLARQAEGSVADLAKKQLSLDAGIKAMRARIEASAHSEAAIRAALEKAQAHQAAASAARKATGRPDTTALAATNPKVRALYEKSFRANLPLKYLPLYHTLGLAPAQIEKFENLLTEREEENVDLQAAAQSQGLAITDPSLATIRQQQDDQLRAAQVSLLGTAGYEQLQQFNRIQPLEANVFAVAAYVPLTSPLTSPQMEQLLNVLANASGSFQAGGTADALTIDRPTALAQASQFLTPIQYAALEAGSQSWQVASLLRQFYQSQTAAK